MFNFFKKAAQQAERIKHKANLMSAAIYKQATLQDFYRTTRTYLNDQMTGFTGKEQDNIMQLLVEKLHADGVNAFKTRASVIFARKP